MRLKKIEQLNTDIFNKTSPLLVKVFESDDFKKKLTDLVQEQATAIIEQNQSFTQLTQDFMLSDYLPTFSANKYITTLFSLMAKKEYYKMLWQKLSLKEKEINKEFEQKAAELLNEITSA